MSPVVVASYNVHGGVDGWGRPFDVVAACRHIDADVLVLQESWSPDGSDSVAGRVARELGYAAVELTLARGRIVTPAADPGGRWGPRLWARRAHGLRLDRGPGDRAGARPGARIDPGVQRGGWGIAVVTRLPIVGTRTIDLPPLPRDPARRAAVVVDVGGDASRPRLRVVGTHLAHMSQGSPRHLVALRRELRSMETTQSDGRTPSVLIGDMNMWGPPLSLMLPGWHRAVRARSWPTWLARPVAQSDHILVPAGVRVVDGDVVGIGGSDHFPVRAVLDV